VATHFHRPPTHHPLILPTSPRARSAILQILYRSVFWSPLLFSMGWQVKRLFFLDFGMPYAPVDLLFGIVCFLAMIGNAVLWSNHLSSKSVWTKALLSACISIAGAAVVFLMISTPNWILRFLGDHLAIIGSPIGIPFPFPDNGCFWGICAGLPFAILFGTFRIQNKISDRRADVG